VVRASRAGRAIKRRRTSIAEETRRDPRSRANSPRRRAARPCSIRVIVFTPFHPSVENARREEGENPRAFNQIGTRPPGRWGNARRATPAPQSKPVAHASRLVAQIAVGGIRAWGENPGRRASSDTTVLRFGPFAYADLKKSARTSPRASADSRQPPGPTPTDHAAPESRSHTPARADHNRE
jgi:hypothetical protein